LIRVSSLPRLCGTAGPPGQVRRRRLCVWRTSADIRCHQPRCSRTWSASPVAHACAALLGRRIKSGGDVGVCGECQQASVAINHDARGLDPRAQSPTSVRHCWAAGSSSAATSVCVGGRQQTSVAINHDARGLDPRAQSPTFARHCWATGSSPVATSVC